MNAWYGTGTTSLRVDTGTWLIFRKNSVQQAVPIEPRPPQKGENLRGEKQWLRPWESQRIRREARP